MCRDNWPNESGGKKKDGSIQGVKRPHLGDKNINEINGSETSFLRGKVFALVSQNVPIKKEAIAIFYMRDFDVNQ